MAETMKDRLVHAWNAFVGVKEEKMDLPYRGGSASYGSSRPDRVRPRFVNERTIISSIYTRLSIDIASIQFRHVKVDEDERFIENVNDGLNECLTVSANIDQTARSFKQDIAMTLFDKGVLAVVPVDTTLDPLRSGSYDIKTMRVGEIVSWHPEHVVVSLYNQKTGLREEIPVPKTVAAVIENPLYAVMNEPNSTLQRLVRKLSLLDAVDEQSSSGKLDLLIKLPYTIRSDSRREQANRRREDIETQLSGSKYGIAYVDGTENITQLNRPVENNLLSQITYLTNMLYSQLGLTPEVFDGSADEKTMLNYFNRTIEPIVTEITSAMHRTFLTKTARSQGHAIVFFRDNFKLVPLSSIAEIADKFTRNEIATSNEIRAVVGWRPSKDPRAETLKNPNMPGGPGFEQPGEGQQQMGTPVNSSGGPFSGQPIHQRVINDGSGYDPESIIAPSGLETLAIGDEEIEPISDEEIQREALLKAKALGIKAP